MFVIPYEQTLRVQIRKILLSVPEDYRKSLAVALADYTETLTESVATVLATAIATPGTSEK